MSGNEEIDQKTGKELWRSSRDILEKNESEAFNKVVSEYGKSLIEPELRPEFIEKIQEKQKEKTVKISNFSSHYGLDYNLNCKNNNDTESKK